MPWFSSKICNHRKHWATGWQPKSLILILKKIGAWHSESHPALGESDAVYLFAKTTDKTDLFIAGKSLAIITKVPKIRDPHRTSFDQYTIEADAALWAITDIIAVVHGST